MKTFETPVINVVTFSVEDVITASACPTVLPDDEF